VITGTGIVIKLEVDNSNQWFVSVWVKIRERSKRVRFKVDTGCNAVVLSRKTLENLGFSTSESDFAKLPSVVGKQASGEKHTFKELGNVSLYRDKLQTVHIGNVSAICHATHETNDLLGTEALQQFCGIYFNLGNEKYIELKT
jgi:predicted aspartyl protease